MLTYKIRAESTVVGRLYREKELLGTLEKHTEPLPDQQTLIRSIFEGTAAETGDRFFAALVKNLTEALHVTGAWVTEFIPKEQRMHSLAFWFQDRYVEHFDYCLAGTPCQRVIEEARLVHYTDDLLECFPGDNALHDLGVIAYMGVPLVDTDDTILGLLGVLHRQPMPMSTSLEEIFKVFAARAAAEHQRMRAEREVRERELKLSQLVNSALDAILELDSKLTVSSANRSATAAFGCPAAQMIGGNFRDFLSPESGEKIARLAVELAGRPEGRQFLWIPGGLQCLCADGDRFPAEASLARFLVEEEGYYTLILRNLHDQVEAERKIETLSNEAEYLKEEIERLQNLGQMAGTSRSIQEILRAVHQVASTDATVLICGETGTGKGLLARAIHAASRRKARPLISVNCAALPATLIESELFGHEKGSFTGAAQKREGRFALAHGGTLFLDEIGELPVELQVKLLRVLQEGEFEPLGSSQTRKVDVRVIAATNQDLPRAVAEGRFREDLFYRLNVFPITVPPLRDRKEDIRALAESFAESFSRRMGRHMEPLSPEAVRRLCAYDWPGNVRELQNVIERAVITCRDGHWNLDAILPPPEKAARSSTATRTSESPAGIRTADDMLNLEKENLVRALKSTAWRVSGPNGAARLLGMPASTLSSRIKALGIRREA